MTDQGERAPTQEPAASIAGRTAAIDAAFADFPELDDDYTPPAKVDDVVETPSGDDQTDSASTKPVAESKPDESARPVEEPTGTLVQSTLEAPKHWPADRRAQFQNLPDDAKRIILDRNKEANVAVTKAQQEAAQYRRTHESLTTVFTDDQKREMQQAGLDEIGAVKHLAELHTAFNRDPLAVFAQVANNSRDPVGFLKAAAERLGVKAEQLFGGSPVTQQQVQTAPELEEWKDPALVAMEAKMEARLAKLTELEQWKAAQEQERQQAQRTEQQRFNSWFTEQCNSFENAMDDEGNPKYPHLPAVIGDVVRLVQTDPAAKSLLLSRPAEALEKAYQQALYLNPDIRQQIIDAEYQRRMAEHEAASSVKKAQAASTRKGSPGANGHAKPRQNMTREEAINMAMQEAERNGASF